MKSLSLLRKFVKFKHKIKLTKTKRKKKLNRKYKVRIWNLYDDIFIFQII